MSYAYQHIADDLTDTFWHKTQMGLNQQMRMFIGLFGVVDQTACLKIIYPESQFFDD